MSANSCGRLFRQLILVVEGEKIKSRLISTRETARLMGLPDSYKLPAAYNEAYHLTGDGVAVPVVRYIARHVIEPIVDRIRAPSEQALPKGALSADVSGNVTAAESVTAQVARLANE